MISTEKDDSSQRFNSILLHNERVACLFFVHHLSSECSSSRSHALNFQFRPN